MLMIERLAHVPRLCQWSALQLLLLLALLPSCPGTAAGQATSRPRLDPMWFASPLGKYSREVDVGDIVLRAPPIVLSGRVFNAEGDGLYWAHVDIAKKRYYGEDGQWSRS